MSTERKNEKRPSPLLPHWMREIALVLILMFCGHLLIGCAVSETRPAADCPQAIPLPAGVRESNLPELSSWQDDVQTYFGEVEIWLQEL